MQSAYFKSGRDNLRFCLVSCFFCLIFSAWTLVCPAEGIQSDTSLTLEEQLVSQKKKIQRVQQGISDHQIRIKKSKTRERSLLSELEEIDLKIISAEQAMIRLNNNVRKQTTLTREKAEELNQVTNAKAVLQKHMKKRLSAYYRMGDIGLMNAIFSSESLPDLLKFQEFFQKMLRYDQQVVTNYKLKIAGLKQVQIELDEEKKRLITAIAMVKVQQKELHETRQARQELLIRVNTEKKLYQRAVEEMEKAAVDLTATMTKLEVETAAAQARKEYKKIKDYPLSPVKKRKPAYLKNFSAQKGRLNPPVQGVIVKKFGENINGKFGVSTFESGIDIQTSPGENILSIFDGKVVYADFLRGYGKMIIIDHGEQYYSLVAGVGEILQKVGNQVKKGDIVATASEHTGLLRQGLHLEIRHGADPQNPMVWLNSEKLTLQSEAGIN
ncbi:MAG: peptidoglycan DD-metalloendopeptidase family protein [Thermodesulfobacteriota bacterium]|nr:peptidoglycan DD-metalloendopeptidase family protein [Thermodesulfobacteriota bacterium]